MDDHLNFPLRINSSVGDLPLCFVDSRLSVVDSLSEQLAALQYNFIRIFSSNRLAFPRHIYSNAVMDVRLGACGHEAILRLGQFICIHIFQSLEQVHVDDLSSFMQAANEHRLMSRAWLSYFPTMAALATGSHNRDVNDGSLTFNC